MLASDWRTTSYANRQFMLLVQVVKLGFENIFFVGDCTLHRVSRCASRVRVRAGGCNNHHGLRGGFSRDLRLWGDC